MSFKSSADERSPQKLDCFPVYSSQGIIRMVLGAIGLIALLATLQVVISG